ncbi:MAG: diacylglycerol kinase family lipid kinase [Chloroflexales bacterium]|nr:diacylglycerol kinase family lipid kinase [Chloroflexales bacterium]
MTIPVNARVCIIANQHAGQAQGLGAAITHAIAIWQSHGWQVDKWVVNHPGHAQELARVAVVQHYDLVIAAGGDGTVNEVANGLMGSDVVLAPLPVGTVNVWAREAGYSMNTFTAVQQIMTGVVGRMDVGRIGEQFFVLMAGVGFDADVVKHLYSHDKRRFGVLAYIGRIITVVWSFRGVDVQLQFDDEIIDVRALMMVVGNTPWYASFIPFTPRATIDDGFLDICLISGSTMVRGPWQFIGLYLKLYFGWHDESIIYRRVRQVHIRGGALPVQIDGDFIGMTPRIIEVLPRALRVLVTTTAAARMFAHVEE